ncbi:MAG TPA: hypothetical protein VFE84_11750 [Patescibacteria group bacterium]|nr:hypothetical protein [Patescibacteria group bacterium]
MQKILEEHPDGRLRVILVWEPVVSTDIAPPTNHALGRLSDSRAAQLWDRELSLSRSIRSGDDEVVWDYVAAFPAEVRWQDGLPKPDFEGSSVLSVIEGLRGWLATQQKLTTDAGHAWPRRSPA